MEEYKPNSHKSKEEQKNLVPEKRVELSLIHIFVV